MPLPIPVDPDSGGPAHPLVGVGGLPIPAAVPLVTASPYYLRDRQNWAVEQERMRHDEALYSIGEYAIFVLMWHIQDLTAGLVQRCSRCYGDGLDEVKE